ncbi:MAG: TonB-dependent receptor [Caulobacteraceae bacterium]
MTKNLLLATCALGALGLSAGAVQAATAAASSTNEGASTVTELVVTAEKREQSLQKVPVAVSVFTGSQRDTIGIESVQDVTNFAPGFTYDPGNVHAYIRGVGRQSINLTDDSRVATYEDGFYVYSAYELDKSSLFLTQEQIERGPQNVGGKGAAGGSIDMISVRPTDQPYAEVRATVANYGTYNFEGAVSGQIAPNLDARLAGYWHNQNQGFYTNVTGAPSEGNEIHEWYIEPQLDWKPNDNLEIWVRGFAASWNNRGDAGARNGYSNGSWDETNLTDANDYPGAALFVNPNYGFAANSPAAAAAALLVAGQAQAIPTNLVVAGPTNITNNPSATDPYKFAAILPRTNTLNAYNGIQTAITYNFPTMQLKYITGYQQYNYTLNYSEPDTNVLSYTIPLAAVHAPGATPLVINPTVDLNYVEDDQWWSHELTLQSTDDNALQWTVGLYYYQQHYINPIGATAAGQSEFGTPVGGPANPNHYLFFNDYSFTYQNESGYAQLSYAINDQWKVTGNIRYSNDWKGGYEEDRDVLFSNGVIPGVGPYLGTLAPLLGGGPNGVQALDVTTSITCPTGTGPVGAASCTTGPLAPGVRSIGKVNPITGNMTRALGGSSDAVTGGADIQWTPSPNIFIYARYGRGYEALSFYAGGVGANPEVKPEFLNSYELGYKETFGRNLLVDLAAFYYDYDNFQVPLSISSGGVVSTEFINVPKAVSTGVELESYWSPIKNLLVTGTWSFDYTAIKTGCSGALTVTPGGTALTPSSGSLCVEDTNDPVAIAPGAHPFPGQTTAAVLQSVKNSPLPEAPMNKIGIDVAYTWHFTPGDLILSGSFVYRSSQDGTVFNRFYDNAPGWTGWNARALWKGPGDKYEFIAYVDNIFNSLQYQAADGGAGLLGTSTTATTVPQNWVNVFNLAPPRTYGVEVRYKFF